MKRKNRRIQIGRKHRILKKNVENVVNESSKVNVIERMTHRTSTVGTALCICIHYETCVHMSTSHVFENLLTQSENEVQSG